ncbi:MAG TPA: LamG-like jellyroll fold domain-containing protein [Sedimentisphaerales bacterium]|nr:LamG-like jellyroll fold domain-containing protein [Sedimentisphaerales bacterium]
MCRCVGPVIVLVAGASSILTAEDARNIRTGWEIPTETYADQPYVVKTGDGAWLCVLTTGSGHEGARGQHVVSLRSIDRGRTWSMPVDVEPAEGPEASYAVLLKTMSGRVYAFYNHNTDNLRQVKADHPPYQDGWCPRVDTQGYFVFKYTDDHGRSWSKDRWAIPVREFEIDRENPYGGKVRFFWNVGKPFTHEGAAFVPLHKVGRFGAGFIARSEGVLLKSPNLLMESDPEKVMWETLPDGNVGLRSPPGGGPIAEEQSFAVLSDGSFYCVYRTVDGHPVDSYSRDGGHTWSEPQYARYADGRLIKHPRAANFVWKCGNGKYLYWFHNHGGQSFDDRNPAWLCGGVEADSPEGRIIRWSQPEVVLYDDDTYIRMSYPDLIDDGGEYFLTETQKDIARVHPVDRSLIEGLWEQLDNRAVATKGLILDLPPKGGSIPARTPMPPLPGFLSRDPSRADYGTKDLLGGFTVELWATFESITPGKMLLDSRNDIGQGWCLRTTSRRTVEIVLNDGSTENRWDCDPGLLQARRLHHIVARVDGGPDMITFLIDGRLCDGGEHRQFGWGRFSPNLRHANGGTSLHIGPSLTGRIQRLRIYSRCLRTSEAVGGYRAGPGQD